MTIASQTSRISYNGDGSTTAFSVPFFFSANSDIVVTTQVTATGTISARALGTDYTLTGATVPAGGTCTFLVAPPVGTLVTILRDPPITQTASYNNNDPFPAKSHEGALDKGTTIDQRTRDMATRSIRAADGDATLDMVLPVAAVRASQALGFDANGKPALFNPASAVTSGTNVTFLQAGTGAVSRTHQDKARDVISVKDFGAVGNGVADDTAKIQAAITYAGTLVAGASVYFPPGNYKVTSTLSVSVRGVMLVGASHDSVNLTRSTAFGPLVSFTTGTSSILDGVGISDMRLVDNGTNNASGIAILCDNVTRFEAFRLTMFGGTSGIVLNAASNVILNSIYMYMQTAAGSPTGRYGVTLTSTATVGAPVAFGSNVQLHNVNIYGGDNVAATYANLNACLLVDCVDGLWISSSYFGGAEVADVQIARSNASYTCGNIYAVNNMMDICRGNGILINGTQLAQRIMFDGSVSCAGVGVAAKDGVLIQGPVDELSIRGTSEGWKGAGVHLGATGGMVCTNVSVIGSIITANNVGVQIEANTGTNQIIITGNNLAGNTLFSVTDSSASTTLKYLEGNLAYSAPWITYTPTISAFSGAVTATAAGRYKQIGSTVTFEVNISAISADTGGSYLTFTLPSAPGNPVALFNFSASENAANIACTARSQAASLTAVVLKYDGTYPSAVGKTFTISGAYQVA